MRFKILVGGRNNPHVATLRLVTPHPLEGALLQHTQEFDLHALRHIANLIQKQGAGGSLLKPAYSGTDGASKGAFFMPEQL